MNVEITVTENSELQALFRRLADTPQLLLQAVGRGMSQAGPVIVGNAVKDRFTSERGPFPIALHKLGRVTGRLRQSITNTKPQLNPASSTVTMGFGSNVKYFAFHEFGFSGNVAVRAHARRNGQQVRGHTRRVNYAGRAPMTTELQTQRTTRTVLDFVTRAVSRALEGGAA